MSEEEKKQEVYENEFIKPIDRVGRITLLLAIFFNLLPIFYLYLAYGAIPTSEVATKTYLTLLSFLAPMYIIEFVSYLPILGSGGLYQCFLSGNTSNCKLPASAAAQAAVGVKEGTREGDIISTIGVTASVLAVIALVSIGATAGLAIVEALKAGAPLALTAFKYVLPGVFGAVIGQFGLRSPKHTVIALCVGLICIGIGIPIFLATPIVVGATLAIGIWLYRRGKKA